MGWWLGGGVGMYAVLAIGVVAGGATALALALSIGAWFFRPLRLVAKLVAVLVILGSITPLMVGAASAAYSRHKIESALASPDLDPSQRMIIQRVGHDEMRATNLFGSGLTCLLLVPAALAALVALTIPKPQPAEEE